MIVIFLSLFVAGVATANFAGNRLRKTSLNDSFGIGMGITILAIVIYMAFFGEFLVYFLVVSVVAFLLGRAGVSLDGSRFDDSSSRSSSSSRQEYQTEEPRRHEPEATIPAFQETVRTEPAPVSQPTSSYNHSTVIDANTIYSYWAFVKTGTGSFIKVTVQAPNSYIAEQMLKNTYGSNLMTGAAMITQ
jgi:hypothetical protein